MAHSSLSRVILTTFFGLTSLTVAQDQIPLVCHDQGVQIIGKLAFSLSAIVTTFPDFAKRSLAQMLPMARMG